MKPIFLLVLVSLCASAVVCSLKVSHLPDTENFILNEFSWLETSNQEARRRLMQSVDHVAASTSKEESVVQAVAKAKAAARLSERLADLFDHARDDDGRVQLRKNLDTLVAFLSGNRPPDLSQQAADILRSFDEAVPSDRLMAQLNTENLRSALGEVLQAYLDSLNAVAEGVTFKFDTGFPSRPKSMKQGLIAFNASAAMEAGRKERIQVRISKDFEAHIREKMAAPKAVEVDSLTVGDIMIVRLEGEDFEIKAHDEEEQGVLDDGYSEWEFDVTPTSSGSHTLYVKAGIVYSVPGLGPTKKFFPVYEKKIDVEVNAWRAVSSFTSQRWEFLISTFLIPALAWAFSRFRRRNQK